MNTQLQQELMERENAVKLNNEGVFMLEAGDFKAGVHELAKALSYYQHIMYKQQQQHSDGLSDDNTSDSSLDLGLDQCMHRLPSQRTTRRSSLVEKLSSSWDDHEGTDDLGQGSNTAHNFETYATRHFVYRQAIEIPKELEENSSNKAAVLISAIIVFNLALGYQFVSLEMVAEHSKKQKGLIEMTGTEDCSFVPVQHLLAKAVKLYELSFSLTHSMPWCVTRANATLFGLSIANNLGVLFHQLNDEARARHCFERVMMTLMFLVEYETQDHTTNNQFQGFLRNAANNTCIFAAARAA